MELKTGLSYQFTINEELGIIDDFTFISIVVEARQILYVFERDDKFYRLKEDNLRLLLNVPKAFKTTNNWRNTTLDSNETILFEE